MKKLKKLLKSQRGDFGMSSLLGVAIAIIIAVFVLIPGITELSEKVIEGMNDWWDDTVEEQIFQESR